MNDDSMIFVLLIIGISTFGWIANNWIRMRHGYEPADRKGRVQDGGSGLEAQRKVELLSAENEQLHGKIGRLEERIAVLERIATDPAERTAREIDSLR